MLDSIFHINQAEYPLPMKNFLRSKDMERFAIYPLPRKIYSALHSNPLGMITDVKLTPYFYLIRAFEPILLQNIQRYLTNNHTKYYEPKIVSMAKGGSKDG